MCPAGLGQLLVWEWQSEAYVLKQQGHFNSMVALAYSPDGQYIVTGGDDGKVRCRTSEMGWWGGCGPWPRAAGQGTGGPAWDHSTHARPRPCPAVRCLQTCWLVGIVCRALALRFPESGSGPCT